MIGQTLSHFKITAKLGEGGMGEVYRAEDTRLGREVAIKVLPPAFTEDAERMARFQREAKILASLSHPNIAGIHQIETVDETVFLVMELVHGEDLSTVLERGPMAVGGAIEVATQIAEALEAAHEQGVVHRDLKPANIKIGPEGQVKILDFGLAKAQEAAGASTADLSRSPTLLATNSPAMTAMGMILGTAAYMAPEQAKGLSVDRRADLWAFGVVLYEMLTGRRAFAEEDVSETLAAVLTRELDFSLLPADTPASIERLLHRCLARDPRERLRDAGDARLELIEPEPEPEAKPIPRPGRRVVGLPVAAAIVAVAVLAGAGAMRLLPSAEPAPSSTNRASLTITLPEGDILRSDGDLSLDLARDGSRLAYVGVRAGQALLFVRDLADPEPRALHGTDGASMPFFSPDGRWLGFFAQGQLKKIGVGGAGLQVVADQVSSPRGGTWGEDGRLYYTPTTRSPLLSVSASGGEPRAVTRLDESTGEISHRWPSFLPDGRTLLFGTWTGPGLAERHIAIRLDDGQHRRIATGDTPRWADGHLLYVILDTLYAVPWDPTREDLAASAPVQQSNRPRSKGESALYAVSEQGVLAYVRGSLARHKGQVLWVDRNGTTEALPLPERLYEAVSLSPDGSRAVVQTREGFETLWIYDFARRTMTPVSTPAGSSQAGIWSADGQHIIYRGTRSGRRNLYRIRADGMGDEERLTFKEGVSQTPHSVSADGEWVVFSEIGVDGGNIFALRLAGTNDPTAQREVIPLIQSPANERGGPISPDGNRLAFVSDVSGRAEIYVQPFPGPGPSTQVSIGGATEPLWSPDGRQLFFVPSSKDRLMLVDVTLSPTFTASQPRALFEGLFKPAINGNTPYAISLDGQRFLRVQQQLPDRAVTRIEIVLDWSPRSDG